MAADKKLIAVVGATGAQGGGLVRAIAGDAASRFRVRALTRHPESESAEALAALGADVVRADLDDVDSLKQAFDGAHGAYCVTNFWEHFSPEKELAQARNLAAAASATRLDHVVWSTLEDTRRWIPLTDDRMPTLMGNYKVPHFDAKGEADGEFRKLGVPTTFMLTSYYWDNLISFGAEPQRDASGQLGFVLPMGDKPLPGIGAQDIGRCAYGIFQRGREFIGSTVGVAGEHLTGQQMATALGEALGEPVRYDAVEPEVYRSFDFPGAQDLANMFQFKRDFNDEFCGARSVEFSRELNPKLQSFSTWLKFNKARIPVKPAG